jgi:hypothetical protein
MSELEKQAARKAARATRESKGAQPENRTQTTSESPPKIETIPHTFSVGAWLLDATKDNTRARKTARKTTSSNPLSQTTIDEIVACTEYCTYKNMKLSTLYLFFNHSYPFSSRFVYVCLFLSNMYLFVCQKFTYFYGIAYPFLQRNTYIYKFGKKLNEPANRPVMEKT